MNGEPRESGDYEPRLVDAAHRVLIDLGQVLASFQDCIVLLGGWTPDLSFPDTEPPHSGSIDVDLALDAAKLGDGRYAELLKLLLETGRYRQGEKSFQLVADVDLGDGEPPVQVPVEFLAADDITLDKNKPKLIPGFRVLQVEPCQVAFHAPVSIKLEGQNLLGDKNTVRFQVISVPDFLIMKAHAINLRDKPKDVYDLCYCLEHDSAGIGALAADWGTRKGEKLVAQAIGILKEKFASVDRYGPRQLPAFYNDANPETRAIQARQAYELVRKFLGLVG